MFKTALASVALLLLASAASAQVIYEPVQYEYSLGDGEVLYYGGSNARVIEQARRTYKVYNQPRSYDGKGRERATIRKGLTGQAPHVYSDLMPYVNLSLYGFTDVDARNEAYANVPTYFRKSDLLKAAVVKEDGSRVVPAQAKPVTEPIERKAASSTQRVRPRAIIIIPKGPKAKPSDKLAVQAK